MKNFINKAIVYPPDTVFLMLLCLLSGLTQLLGNATVENLVPASILQAWASLLLLGSLVTLAGIFIKAQPKGMLIEQAGRHMLWPASFAYAVAIWYYNHDRLSVFLVVAFGVTCVVRILYIRRLINEWKGILAHE